MTRNHINRRSLARTLMGGVAGLAVIFSATPALAQATGPQPVAVDDASRETVVVVGTIEETLPQELEKYGSDLETIGEEQLRNSSFVDVTQALQMVTPGLFIAPRGGPFSYMDISLQGSRTQDMLFLVDGVRINNRLYSGTISDTLPASMVERVEVLKGGQSLFYGTQAAAGVINVVTRGYTDDFNGRATIGGDTNDSIHLDGFVRGKLGPGNYVLFASQDKSDGFQAYTTVQPSVTDRNRSYDMNNVGAKYRLNFSDDLTLDARYTHTDGRLDYAGAVNTAFSKNERDEDIASVNLDWTPSDVAQFFVKGYWHDWDSQYTTINNRFPLGSGQTVLDNQTYWGYEDMGLNAVAKLAPHKGLEYLVGYDYQTYNGRDDVLLIKPQDETVNAVFAQVRTTSDMIENGAFAAGVRYTDTGGTTNTIWNLSGRYDFAPWIYVQGVLGTSFLLPTAEQLFAEDDFDPLGNPNLEPEKSENLNLAVGGNFDAGSNALSWQVTYFARNIDNLIGDVAFADVGLDPLVLYPNARDPDPTTAYNEIYDNGLFYNVPGEVEVRGFELLGTAQLGDAFSVTASYTNTKSEMKGANSQIARIPKEFAKLSASYSPPQTRFGVDASALWNGEQRATVTGFGLVNYGDYVVVDLAAHYFIDAAEHHKLTLRLENALDEDYMTRPGSALVDGTGTRPRFFYGNSGVPQTLHVSYTYAF